MLSSSLCKSAPNELVIESRVSMAGRLSPRAGEPQKSLAKFRGEQVRAFFAKKERMRGGDVRKQTTWRAFDGNVRRLIYMCWLLCAFR